MRRVPMELAAFLSPEDACRAQRTLEKLREHFTTPLVLAGGLAVEFHLAHFEPASQSRPLNDLDFLADSFDEIPRTLAADFLVRHVHPGGSAGSTLFQCVDPETAVRVDVFRACGDTTRRAEVSEIVGAPMLMISLSDLAAHAARLCMALATGTPTPAKHAVDLLRTLPFLEPDATELAWRDHRKTNHPETFNCAADLLRGLITARADLLITPSYSQDIDAVCPRCEAVDGFQLAPASRILSLLGYC